MGFTHSSVLLDEAIGALGIRGDGIYVDATFGRGGHSREILRRLGEGGRLYAIDRDQDAVEAGRDIDDARFTMVYGRFSELKRICREFGILGKVDGLLMDIGVSSPQLDDPERGFSFIKDGPLDMRMDKTSKTDARTVVNSYGQDELARIFREYGEERYASRVAAAIVRERQKRKIETTLDLAAIVDGAVPFDKKSRKHKATRVFQALRIEVNHELDELREALDASIEVLADQGILAVISFHSLEDRMVKQFMRTHSTIPEVPSGIPLTQEQLRERYGNRVLFGQVSPAIRAGAGEQAENIRSRSAVLRVARRIKGD